MTIQSAPLPAFAFEEGTPRVQQIVDQLSAAIADGRLPQGARLPPVREMTVTLGVSKFTVIDALERLRGRGLLTSRQGAGHFVARRTSRPDNTAMRDLLPQDLISVLRRSLIADTAALRPGCGFLPESWLASDDLRRAMRGAVKAASLRTAGYGVPAGYLPLRQALREKLGVIGLEVPVEQIVTTANTMQAIDMLLRLLLQPGDKVLLDDPCYFNFHANLALHGASAVVLPRGPSGLDLDRMEVLLAEHRPRLYVTNSVLHNPTGQSLTPAQAFRLLQLARQYGLHIIEDDLYGDVQPLPAPRLAALDGLEQASYVSGFSKTLTANTRVSFVATSPELAARLTSLKLMGGGITSELSEQIVYRMLSNGSYTKHLHRLAQRLPEAADRVGSWLQQAGCSLPFPYHGGFFHWARLPDGVDGEALAMSALREDLVLAPGTLLSRDPDSRHFMRFNVAHSDSKEVRDRVSRLLGSQRPAVS